MRATSPLRLDRNKDWNLHIVPRMEKDRRGKRREAKTDVLESWLEWLFLEEEKKIKNSLFFLWSKTQQRNHHDHDHKSWIQRLKNALFCFALCSEMIVQTFRDSSHHIRCWFSIQIIYCICCLLPVLWIQSTQQAGSRHFCAARWRQHDPPLPILPLSTAARPPLLSFIPFIPGCL